MKDAGKPKIDPIQVASLGTLIKLGAKILKRTGNKIKKIPKPKKPTGKKPSKKPETEKPIDKDKSTKHGVDRGKFRKITDKEAKDAIDSAKKSGKVTTKIGKYGTKQKHYEGSNGITVIVETEGRNAGKIITIWRRK